MSNEFSTKKTVKQNFCRSFIIFVSIYTLFSLVSCSKKGQAQLLSLSGYLEWKKNNWNEASSKFMEVYETAEEIGSSELKNYAIFGIGSTYIMQDENDAALLRFEKLKNCKDEELNAAIFYQLGVIALSKEKYAEAADFFKKSLEISADSIDTKINYELSKKYLENSGKNSPLTKNSAASEKDSVTDEEKIIMEMVRQKEVEQWEKKKQNAGTPVPYDY